MTILRALRPAAVPAVVFAAAAMLSGCVSLFPKTPPAQLYRFGYHPAATPAACDGAAPQTGVISSPPDFPRASASDQILTLSGEEASYIGASRWVSPANTLFEDAIEQAFESSCRVRLVRRQDFGAGSVRMRLDVDRFETAYPAGALRTAKDPASAPPPTVTVSFKALLMKRGGDFGAERLFKASVPAADNRVGAIVAAYSAATSQAVGELVAWTEQQAPQIQAAEDGAHPVIDRPAPPLRQSSTSTTTTTSSSSESTVATPR